MPNCLFKSQIANRTAVLIAISSTMDPDLVSLCPGILPSTPASAFFHFPPIALGSWRFGSTVVANEKPARVVQVAQDAIKCQLSIGKQLPTLALCRLEGCVMCFLRGVYDGSKLYVDER